MRFDPSKHIPSDLSDPMREITELELAAVAARANAEHARAQQKAAKGMALTYVRPTAKVKAERKRKRTAQKKARKANR